MVRIYAPCNEAELARVIRPGGTLLTVTPGARHLQQLKAQIYPQVHLHTPEAKQYAGFQRQDGHALHYTMTLQGEEATALLQMTPFAWRAKPAVWEELRQAVAFCCDVDFQLTRWRRV